MTTTEVVITQRITIDSEIADEIVWLNANGVRTEGCCSGHGKARPTAMITPSSAERARELGYHPWLVQDLGLYEIKLRGYVPDSGGGIVDGMEDSMWEGRYFCYCGAKMKIDAPPHVVAEAKRIFWREHDGPGHGICDEKTCDAARLRAEQMEMGL